MTIRDTTRKAILDAHVLGKGGKELVDLAVGDGKVTHAHLEIAKRAFHDAGYATRSDYKDVANFGFDGRGLNDPQAFRDHNADRMRRTNVDACQRLVTALEEEITRQGILPTLGADVDASVGSAFGLREPTQRWLSRASKRWLGTGD